ncbi:MAG: DnaJ domain-containing protein [Chloroflexota bacterium]
MHACPSCGSPLDNDGICTSCGALSRGFFRDLDLGNPQLAQAVGRGLDFYLLLGVNTSADTRLIARRYRQLRAHFPDDPSKLAPKPAKRLRLLEVAGRTLTDPTLRQTYDDLRASPDGQLTTQAIRCTGCAAPLPQEAEVCPFCGTPRPPEPELPTTPPDTGPLASEPVDYYALIGQTPQHLITVTPQFERQQYRPIKRSLFSHIFTQNDDDIDDISRLSDTRPPSAVDIDAVARQRQHDTLLLSGLTKEEREARVNEIEMARRILRDERLRGQYDAIWRNFRDGKLDRGVFESLHHLQNLVRSEIAEETGEPLSPEEGAELLKHGTGYLKAQLPREAIPILRRAVAALPDSTEALHAYTQAILAAGDPLDLGGHKLRQVLKSIEQSAALQQPVENGTAIAALCRGLLARDAGDTATAETELRQATQLDPQFATAWRGLAALALTQNDLAEVLHHCRRAIAIDPRDERALLMMAAACVRHRKRKQAREIAVQIAALRGDGWRTDDVLREIGG